MPLVKIGSQVIETADDPDQDGPTFDLVFAIVTGLLATVFGIRAANAIKRFEKHEAELYAHSGQDEEA